MLVARATSTSGSLSEVKERVHDSRFAIRSSTLDKQTCEHAIHESGTSKRENSRRVWWISFGYSCIAWVLNLGHARCSVRCFWHDRGNKLDITLAVIDNFVNNSADVSRHMLQGTVVLRL
eukprot:SAG31_NODE_442_length_15661_cov_4.132245_3_plen_120_part_00